MKQNFLFLYFSDKQVFSDLDFLGWYTTGESPTEQDIQVHKQICNINECPIMLQLNPQSRNVDVSHNFFVLCEYFDNICFCSNCQLFCTNQLLILYKVRQQCYTFR